MTSLALLLCMQMGMAVAFTCIIMARYWPDPRWWHVFSVGLSHLILMFSSIHTVIVVQSVIEWKLCLLIAAYTLTDFGLWMFLVRGSRAAIVRKPAPPLMETGLDSPKTLDV